jgi:hypothetical protein
VGCLLAHQQQLLRQRRASLLLQLPPLHLVQSQAIQLATLLPLQLFV